MNTLFASEPDFNFANTGTGQPMLNYTGPLDDRPFMSEAAAEALANAYDKKQIGGKTFYFPVQAPSNLPITITAAFGWKGSNPEDGEVYILADECNVEQGSDKAGGPKGVVWIRRKGTVPGLEEDQAFVYFEKNQNGSPLPIELNSVFVEAFANDLSWFGLFRTTDRIDLRIAEPGTNQVDPDKIFFRAEQMRARYLRSTGKRTQTVQESFPATSSTPTGVSSALPPSNSDKPGHSVKGSEGTGFGAVSKDVEQTSRLTESIVSSGGTNPTKQPVSFRKLRIFSRYESDSGFRIESDPLDSSRQIVVIERGVTVIIEQPSMNGQSIPGLGAPENDIIDISADSAVIWTSGLSSRLHLGEVVEQSEESDLEIFLTGDIVFRQGERVLYAKNMYYDGKHRIGLVRDTEAIVPIPNRPDGYMRVKADEIEQYSPNSILAKNSWFTTSMMGEPGYRLQSGQIRAESRKAPLFDTATGQRVIDPKTGLPAFKEDQFLISENNTIAVESIPIFYWPWLAMDTRDQTLYLRHLKVGNDSIFGTQVRTTWNPYQIFNMSDYRPEGTDWDLNLDFLSKRGLGHGTSFLYDRENLFGWQTRAIGMANYFGISDKGTDNLGRDRRNVPFEHSYRYRVLWKHRQLFDLPENFGLLGNQWELNAQVGKSSDRNFIPEYFEQEWYNNSNPETSIGIRKVCDNSSFSLGTSFRLDDFYTQTSRLPQADHFWLGKPLFGCNNLLWYEHTKFSYSQFRTTDAPYAAEDLSMFRYLDWELAANSQSNIPDNDETKTLSANSFNFSTRHELDVPLQAGPVKIVPYLLGEYAFWGTGRTENDINRLYGRGGVRFNLPIWKVDSDVSSELFYLNGLAHKMNFVVDASWSGSTVDFDKLVLYDALDDWQVEEFRRRYSVTTYGGSIPLQYDERFYALRQGLLGGSVSSPNTEIADDLQLVRFEWQNRWQTKRGPVGKRHTIDWITFNTGINFYPDKKQNYDEYIGLLDYDLSWHVGDRFSVLSSGIYDVFNSGQRVTRLGVMARRPWLGNVYVGVDRFGGPLNNTYLNASINYRTAEKWAVTLGNSYDLSLGENVGQNFGVSRIGESFIFTLSGNINTSKDNWGLSLSVIPVFLVNPKKMEEGLLDFKHAM